ncbi:hypothetical protein [Candidatus Vidania fulgoroideorum]
MIYKEQSNYRINEPAFISVTFSFRRTNSYNRTVDKCMQYSRIGCYIVPHIPCLNNSCYYLKKIVGVLISNNIITYLLLRGDMGIAKSFDNTIDLSLYIIHTFSKIRIMLPFYYEGHGYFRDINFDIYNVIRKRRGRECFLISQVSFYSDWKFLIKKSKWICLGIPALSNIIKIWGLTRALDITIPLSIYQLFRNQFFLGYKTYVKNIIKPWCHIHLYTFNNNILSI